ncbi:MAG: cation diffusion facilitator family transporter, partial [Chromatiaceae bacterium]
MHGHSHDAHHHGADAPDSRRILILTVALTFGYALVEGIGGWWASSLALMSDAGHMVTDSIALTLAAMAAILARRPPSKRHSYGLGRLETLAALFNSLFMVVIVAAITAEAMQRLLHPPEVRGSLVIWIALVGLGVNLGAASLLMKGRANINVRAALLHVVGDLLGSVA